MVETTIEWVQGEDYCNVYTGERKFVNKILELHKEYPNEVTITDYGDGYLSAHVP